MGSVIDGATYEAFYENGVLRLVGTFPALNGLRQCSIRKGSFPDALSSSVASLNAWADRRAKAGVPE